MKCPEKENFIYRKRNVTNGFLGWRWEQGLTANGLEEIWGVCRNAPKLDQDDGCTICKFTKYYRFFKKS